jgi:XTP/dITP diphosphohydrolase
VEILIASYNSGKIREVREALADLPLTLRTLDEFPEVIQVEESGKTYQENAVLKAIGYATQTGLTALADDSGLEVDALDGRPGVYSARFGGEGATDSDRVAKLLTLLSHQPDDSRGAEFVCCMALANPSVSHSEQLYASSPVLAVFEERCLGTLSHSARGTNGFGYDPIFIPSGYELSFGELATEVKRKLSHRGKALSAVRAFVEGLLSQT